MATDAKRKRFGRHANENVQRRRSALGGRGRPKREQNRPVCCLSPGCAARPFARVNDLKRHYAECHGRPANNKTAHPDDASAPDKASCPDDVPAADEASAPEKSSCPDDVPAADEASAPEKSSCPDEAHAADEASAPDKASAHNEVSVRKIFCDYEGCPAAYTRVSRLRDHLRTEHGEPIPIDGNPTLRLLKTAQSDSDFATNAPDHVQPDIHTL
ncbi:hypothetical protein Purlil1_11812 [Purpureocillium lilacinum]|uniref:C2H2-type domain-containing protein n=1 Tax=Purpureocillium lilacinum TaxID=33203 RepID=A0ABR0BIK2_PURLI|nr:hypothetical protein Purlil1_11812 [Purpureocillium lilacinum]